MKEGTKTMGKKYQLETIKKAVNNMQEKIKAYQEMDVNEIKMCISTGNMKIGHVLNVSLAPVITCHNCSECKFYCYDIKAVLAYPSCCDARARNTAIFMKDRDEFFNRLHKRMINRKKDFYLRFHVSGEIIDVDHFSRMVETARMFPNFTIWTYTKNYWIVNQYVAEHGGSIKAAIPDNFSVMFSEWDGMPMINPYGFKVFKCVLKGQKAPKGWFKCPGNCNDCKAAKKGCIGRHNTFCFEH